MIGMASSGIHDFDARICEITLAHQYNAPKGDLWSAYREGRKVWGVSCISTGEMQHYYQDGQCKRLFPGDVAIIPASVSYLLTVPQHVEECLHYTINFRMEGDLSAHIPLDKATIIHPADFDRFEKNFEKCVHTWAGKELGYRMQALSYLYQIMHDILLAKVRAAINPAAFQQTLPAQEYMSAHFTESITLNKLADLCGVSVTHFRRLFRQAYNVSPIDYLLNLRLEKAKDLLVIHDLKLDAIAELSGFQSASYFVRYFKQRTGITPAQYRRLNT